VTVAQSAGEITRHAVGTPAFGGMIFAALFGVFLIPLLYITAESVRYIGRRKQAGRSSTPTQP
jgi:hydrophobic/amphiphilic exporter-1 (mainly G- bacteria), HAE1 family